MLALSPLAESTFSATGHFDTVAPVSELNFRDSVFQRLACHRFTAVLLLLCMACGIYGCRNPQFGNSDWLTPPWIRKEWEAEEKIADSLFARKAQMNQAVAAVAGGTVESQQQVANKLSEIILRDPVLLLRLHAIQLMTSLDCPKTVETLNIAASDPSSDIRIAAVEAFQRIPGQDSIYQLQEIIANDTDDDVRLAAVRALGNLPGQSSVRALGVALNDRNPALQISATESLMQATGQPSIGRDVAAWQNYVQQVAPSIESTTTPSGVTPTTVPGSSSKTLTAEDPSGGSFRR